MRVEVCNVERVGPILQGETERFIEIKYEAESVGFVEGINGETYGVLLRDTGDFTTEKLCHLKAIKTTDKEES